MMVEERAIIPTRFLVKNEDGSFVVSGHPGVALCHFAITKLEGYEKAFDWYQSVVKNNTSVEVRLSESIRELRLAVIHSLDINTNVDSSELVGPLFLGTAHELAWFENEAITVGEALRFFSTDELVSAYIMLNNSAGELFRGEDEGIRYYIRSNERGHSPHVHVSYRNELSASLYIENGGYRDGSLPSKAYRVAKERILSNQEMLLNYWNLHTNGIHFDINYLFANQSGK